MMLFLIMENSLFAAEKSELNTISSRFKSALDFIEQHINPPKINKHTTKLDAFSAQLVDAALERTKHHVRYEASYVVIPYPNGDVPENIGVCTDEVIRAYRTIGVDLQKDVHEDMAKHFVAYPKHWGLKKPDKNIDHRRVPNLETLFKRKGKVLEISQTDASLYHAGDVVTWKVQGLPHIGMVTDQYKNNRPMIVHNIGAGPQLEDMLFNYPITGHFRYVGAWANKNKKKTVING